MANPTCDASTLVNDEACLQCFDQNELMALIIYFNALELNAIGGTDYVTDFPQDLVDAAQANWMRFTDPAKVLMALAAVAKNNATAAGATVPTDLGEWRLAIRKVFNFNNPAILGLQLNCELGVHKAYPQ